MITVIIPQFVPEDWADLGGAYVYRAGLRHWIKRALFLEPNVIVADVPYHLRPEDHASHESPADASSSAPETV
jgi:hypothetical protein